MAGAPLRGLSPLMSQNCGSRVTPEGWFKRPSWRKMKSQGELDWRLARKGLMSAFRKLQEFHVQMAMLFLAQHGGMRLGVPGRLVYGLRLRRGGGVQQCHLPTAFHCALRSCSRAFSISICFADILSWVRSGMCFWSCGRQGCMVLVPRGLLAMRWLW